MRALILAVILAASSAQAEITHIPSRYNEVLAQCLEYYGYDKTAPIEQRLKYDFTKASRCANNYLTELNKARDKELRDFLAHNPRYRAPGQSLNKCYGKPRVNPFESSGIEVTKDGYYAWVNYKDEIPAGCYENAPWDNRDNK